MQAAAQASDCWLRAAAAGDVEELRRLADWGASLDACDFRGLTALMISAAHGHTPCVLFLAQRGVSLDAIDRRGWTAVIHAAFHGRDGCLHVLAELGADLNVRDFLGTTAAMRAVLGGHLGCLRTLAEHRADLSTRDKLDYNVAAHARRRGNDQCLQFLSDCGIPVEATSEEGCPQLCKAQVKALKRASTTRPCATAARSRSGCKGRQELLGRFIASAICPRSEKDCLFGMVALRGM